MKSVLISIQPKWCELIASGRKTVEFRKTKPKLETPFKVYIYCTIDEPLYRSGEKFWCKNAGEFGNGKVIGEFICDEILSYNETFFDEQEPRDTEIIGEFLDYSCLKYSELCAYVGLKDFYGWHISDLVIYDNPRDLSEFEKPHDYLDLSYSKRNSFFKGIRKGPQSWCYVNSLKENI